MAALSKLVDAILDPRSVLLAAWLLFCGWSYVQSFLGQFGFQASLSDIPLDHYLYYSLRPVLGPIETFDILSLVLLLAIFAVAAAALFVPLKWPVTEPYALMVCAALAFALGHGLAARIAFNDAKFLARGCGTAAYVVFASAKADDLALTAGPLIRANQDHRLMLAWRTTSTLLVVDSDPLAFEPCVRVYRDVEARRQAARSDADSPEALRASNRRACNDLQTPVMPVSFAIRLDGVEAVLVQDTIGPLARRFRFLAPGVDHACAI